MFERWFIHDSYACRKNKGLHKAVHQTQEWSRKYTFFLKADISKFFDSVDHDVLKNLLSRKLKDQKLSHLPNAVLGKGIPIGNLTSQYFANFYLTPMDRFIKEKLGVKAYIRYMDDFLLFSSDKEQLHRWYSEIKCFLQQNVKLHLKTQATFIGSVSEGIPFLGFRIFPYLIRLKRESKARFIRKLKAMEKAFYEGELDEQSLLQSVQSLLAHIRHADTYRLRTKIYEQYGMMLEG